MESKNEVKCLQLEWVCSNCPCVTHNGICPTGGYIAVGYQHPDLKRRYGQELGNIHRQIIAKKPKSQLSQIRSLQEALFSSSTLNGEDMQVCPCPQGYLSWLYSRSYDNQQNGFIQCVTCSRLYCNACFSTTKHFRVGSICARLNPESDWNKTIPIQSHMMPSSLPLPFLPPPPQPTEYERYLESVFSRLTVIEPDFGEDNEIQLFNLPKTDKLKVSSSSDSKEPVKEMKDAKMMEKKPNGKTKNKRKPAEEEEKPKKKKKKEKKPKTKVKSTPIPPPPPKTEVKSVPLPSPPPKTNGKEEEEEKKKKPEGVVLGTLVMGKNKVTVRASIPCPKANPNSNALCMDEKCHCTKYVLPPTFDAQAVSLPWIPNPVVRLAHLNCKGIKIFCRYCYVDGSNQYLNDAKNCENFSRDFSTNAPRDASQYCLRYASEKKKFWQHDSIQREDMWKYIVIDNYISFYIQHIPGILAAYNKDLGDEKSGYSRASLSKEYKEKIKSMKENWTILQDASDDIVFFFTKGLPIGKPKLNLYLMACTHSFRWTTCNRMHPVLIPTEFTKTKCVACKH